jgi:hypothetical protein
MLVKEKEAIKQNSESSSTCSPIEYMIKMRRMIMSRMGINIEDDRMINEIE